MPSLRAKLIHAIFKLMWSSKKEMTKERLQNRYKANKFGRFIRTPQPVSKTQITIHGIPVDIIEPKNKKSSKVVIYLHGGGFVYGMTSGHYELVNRLAVQAGIKIFLVHYSLAPEHTFPAQLNEIKNVYLWLIKNGYKTKDIYFAGDSAGGNMAVATALLLKEKRLTLPKGIIAISPVLDATFDFPSFVKNEPTDFILNSQKMHFFRNAYIGKESLKHPLVSPTFASLKGLPKIQLFVGGNEVLIDDVVIFSEKLKKAKVPYELHIGESLMHVYPLAAWLFPEAKESIRSMARFIKEDKH